MISTMGTPAFFRHIAYSDAFEHDSENTLVSDRGVARLQAASAPGGGTTIVVG